MLGESASLSRGKLAPIPWFITTVSNGDLLGIPLPVMNLAVRWSANRGRF
jgi:hypothetical protein